MYFYTLVLTCILVGSIGIATMVHLGQKRAERRSAGVQRLRNQYDHLNEIIDRLHRFPIDGGVLQVLADERRKVANALEAEHDAPVGVISELPAAPPGATFRHDDELGLRKSVAACRKGQRMLHRIAKAGGLAAEAYPPMVRELGRAEVRMQVETLESLGETNAESDRLTALRYLRQAAELLMKHNHLDKGFARTLHQLRSRIATIQSGLAADNVRVPDAPEGGTDTGSLSLQAMDH